MYLIALAVAWMFALAVGTWVMRRCSCCCINQHCGYDDDGQPIIPERLSFVASIAGSCPGAEPDVVSGIVSMYGSDWGPPSPSPDSVPARCDDTVEFGEDPCLQRFTGTCGCIYSWYVAEADIPDCGPFIESVILQCLRSDRHPFPDCPHVDREGCLWYVQVNVARALALVSPGGHCRIEISLPPDPPSERCFCTKQNDTTCAWEEIEVPCPIDPDMEFCSPFCPPCYDCPDHNTRRCAAGESCCGEDGCQFCECPTDPPCTGDCAECTHCIEEPPSGYVPPDPGASCVVPCPGTRAIRYHFWLSGDNDCTGGGNNDIKGCNPKSCGPDTDNTGDFYLRVGCSETDWVEFACP
jgi:hypothetical protein